MLNNQQIKLVQTAVKSAGIRTPQFDGRYRMLLATYKQSNGCKATTCKQLNNHQLDDLLAICESLGWQYPGKEPDYYRHRVAEHGDSASFAQAHAIKYLAGDLGWDDRNLAGFIRRQTQGRTDYGPDLTSTEAWKVIEGLKAILGRDTGRKYNSLTQVKSDMEVKDGQANKVG